MAERVVYTNGVPAQQQRSKLDPADTKSAPDLLHRKCSIKVSQDTSDQGSADLHFTELEEQEAAEVKNSVLPHRGGFKCRLTVGVGCLPPTSDVEKCIFGVHISKVSPSLLKREQVAAAELPLSQLLTLWQQSPSPHDCL